MKPIKTEFIEFKKFKLLKNRILIGIDSGCSLTKIIFLNKENYDQWKDNKCDIITFQFSIFDNRDFKYSIQWLKEIAYIPEDTSSFIHGSGVGCISNKLFIENILGLKLVIVNEGLTIVAGHKIGLDYLDFKKIVQPPLEIEKFEKFESEMMKRITSSIIKKVNAIGDSKNIHNSSHFPFLLCFCGSSTNYYYFDENGMAEEICFILHGGKTFLGLGKCLLDTNNYDEIIELAKNGDRKKVDTLVEEIMEDKKYSPYGKLPLKLPVFSFGKHADYNEGVEFSSKEDLAASLVAMSSALMMSNVSKMCIAKKVKKVFYSGNTVKSNLFQKEIEIRNQMFSVGLEFTSLNMAFASALGTMLTTNEDMKQYYK